MKNKGAVLGLLIIAAALAFGAVAFRNSLVTYVPFAEARAAADTSVQIIGAPLPGMTYVDGALHFSMRDDRGAVMPVVFRGPKPEDLDSAMGKAVKITAQGAFDRAKGVFVADTLLVKCPSKYQGAPGGSERSYGAS